MTWLAFTLGLALGSFLTFAACMWWAFRAMHPHDELSEVERYAEREQENVPPAQFPSEAPIDRLKVAAAEFERALNEYGPGVDVDVSTLDVSTMALIGVLYSVRLQMQRDPLPIYP